MPASRRPLLAVAAIGALLTVGAWSAFPAGAAGGPAVTDGVFDVPGAATTAVTYDVAQVPVGAEVDRPRGADRQPQDGRSRCTPAACCRTRRTARTRTTGRAALTGAAAGAHYQNVPDPAVGGSETVASTDAAYANPSNEVWLDLETNAAGNGRAQTVVDWTFRPTADGAPRSVILHLNTTSTGGTPPAGNAGARLACVTISL